ncbi:MAG: helix-turn-helix domain-containing protein [Bacteroidales bacterium]|nr:helix-turn-helix domain-containing protein [Bacteroidales bacterium]
MNVVQIESLTVQELKKLVEDIVASYVTVSQPDKNNSEDLLTRPEVATLLKISLVTLNSWTKQGKVPSYRIGSRVYYKRCEIEKSLKARKYN